MAQRHLRRDRVARDRDRGVHRGRGVMLAMTKRPDLTDYLHTEAAPIEVVNKRTGEVHEVNGAYAEYARAAIRWDRMKAASDHHERALRDRKSTRLNSSH